LWIPTF